MIARHWRGLVKRDRAAAYVEHLQSATLPQLVQLAGFHDARVLRRDLPQGVEFLVVTIWESLDSIRAFAGNDVESAVVPAKARDMMIEYDHRARHYESWTEKNYSRQGAKAARKRRRDSSSEPRISGLLNSSLALGASYGSLGAERRSLLSAGVKGRWRISDR